MYLDTIRRQFCDQNITTILTTHSPATVSEIKPKELFELSIDNNMQKITCANDEDGKKRILQKLAPKFVYYSELGCFEYILTSDTNTIVLLEGKNDTKNFDALSDQYTFIDCGGAGNIKNMLIVLESIPLFQDLIKDKLIIALFDFDTKGRDTIKDRLDSILNDEFTKKIANKVPFICSNNKQLRKSKIYYENNIYYAMFVPSNEKKWSYSENKFRHQELKTEDKDGSAMARQKDLLDKIVTEHENKKITSNP